MVARLLLPLFAVGILGASGQMGMYGTVTTHVKAGDLAPDITFSETLSSPVPATWNQSNLSGQVTVLVFFPDTSHNLQSVTLWNKLVEKFTGKPVQFVWITGEKDATLQPWLAQHPIRGWVFQDTEGKTGNAYGMEFPDSVIVGADRKIIGFYKFALFEGEAVLNAVLEGRVTTTPPTKETAKAFQDGNLVLLDAEPYRMPRPDDYKPAFTPSETVHISPSQGEGGGNFGGPDFWSLKGYPLKSAIEEVYGEIYRVDTVRMQFPASLDNGKRYDFSLVLPREEDREKIKVRFQKAIQDYFHITVRRENRIVDVYVVTVDKQHGPPAVQTLPKGGGFIQSSGMGLMAAGGSDDGRGHLKVHDIAAIRSLAFDGTADDFCNQLEASVGRPVVNETDLDGIFEINIGRPESEGNDFLKRLRDEAGLVITPGERNVEMLVVEAK